MQIVIDIPEKIYIHLHDGGSIGASLMIENAIKKGTPLPKGHGDLIDINDIEWARHQEERDYIDYDVIDWDDIKNASIIIPADKEEE